jgi:hypothetical protein
VHPHAQPHGYFDFVPPPLFVSQAFEERSFVIPLSPKEIIIRMARCILGEARVHDHLIERGIKLRHLRDGYTENNENRNDSESRQTLIFMADGKWMHGGLTDRLRGMTSAYKFAKEHNLDFKIYHTSPFELQEILQPNNVKWVIGEKEISRNCEVAKPVLLYREDFNNDSALERQIDSKHKQFHLYSCVDTVGEDFSKYFNELFKPSPILEQEISHYSELLGESYTAISFRFQNKLGDFKEFSFKELPEKGKHKLMNACCFHRFPKTLKPRLPACVFIGSALQLRMNHVKRYSSFGAELPAILLVSVAFSPAQAMVDVNGFRHCLSGITGLCQQNHQCCAVSASGKPGQASPLRHFRADHCRKGAAQTLHGFSLL